MRGQFENHFLPLAGEIWALEPKTLPGIKTKCNIAGGPEWGVSEWREQTVSFYYLLVLSFDLERKPYSSSFLETRDMFSGEQSFQPVFPQASTADFM